MDTGKSKVSPRGKIKINQENLHDHIIAAMCDGCRLYFVFDQLLDTDLQPDANDFSVACDESTITIRAATLKSAVRKGKTWSLISLLLDKPITSGINIRVSYHPRQWFLWSLDNEEPIEPFEFGIKVSDTGTVHGISLETENFNLEAVPSAVKKVDCQASVEFAVDRRVKISFGCELDLAQQPKAEDFRAEIESSWLNIGSVHLARAGKTKTNSNNLWPELWVMLRDPVPVGSTLEIAYKPADTGLRAVDGSVAEAFRVACVATAEEPAASNSPARRTPEAPTQPQDSNDSKTDNIVSLFSEAEAAPAASTETSAAPANSTRNASKNPINPEDYHNPYADRESEEVKAAAEKSEEDAANGESPLSQETEEEDVSILPLYADYERPVTDENQGALPIVRTYLADGTSVTLDEDDLAAMVAEQPLIEAEVKFNYIEGLKQASPPIKAAVGVGFVLVGWLAIALLSFVIKLFGVNFSSGSTNDITIEESNTHNASIMSILKRAPCKMEYPDGSRFEGECRGKKRDGGGAYYWASGDVYKGDWAADKQHGNGMLQYKNGDIYTGTFAENQKDGMGAMRWANGAKYQGGYKNGKFHGRGTYWSTSGTRFEGVFENGHTTNDGTCFLPDGTNQPGACTQ